jgi:hypothetical protein
MQEDIKDFKRISKGFSELTLQRKLSFQILNLLERIMTWLRTEANTVSKAATSPSPMADDVLGRLKTLDYRTSSRHRFPGILQLYRAQDGAAQSAR